MSLFGKPNPPTTNLDFSTKSVARAVLANFARVVGTPEELVLEFGLNSNPIGQEAADPLHVHSQVVLTFATASSLWQQLSGIIRDYETRHGDLELDVAKRVR